MSTPSLRGGSSSRHGPRWARLLGGAVLAGALGVLATGCNQGAPQAKGAKAVEVAVTRPITDEVTDYQDFTGRLDAFKTVDIRARVSGYVQDAPFKEGDVVHEGDLLFQVDPQPYEADYNQAVANLKQAEADRDLQARNVARVQRMLPAGSIGREEYDQTVAAHAKAVATVGSMAAARDRAKLYLGYTRVCAPLSGRISRRYVDPGNLVTADNTMLTTIVSEDPVYAYFDVDERTYLDLLHSVPAGQGSWFTGPQFPVWIRLANEQEFTHAGTINFIDNRVNAGTGTVRMRGVFRNSDGYLKPGLFVRIRLPVGAPYRAILVPDEAFLSDQGRKYVYTVNDKGEAAYRSVTLGQAVRGLRVVKEGLSVEDRVIVTGMQRVKAGTPVTATVQKPPKPPGSPVGKLPAAPQPKPAGKKPSGKG
jgi:RND family efflux transporter MFP subunit